MNEKDTPDPGEALAQILAATAMIAGVPISMPVFSPACPKCGKTMAAAKHFQGGIVFPIWDCTECGHSIAREGAAPHVPERPTLPEKAQPQRDIPDASFLCKVRNPEETAATYTICDRPTLDRLRNERPPYSVDVLASTTRSHCKRIAKARGYRLANPANL